MNTLLNIGELAPNFSLPIGNGSIEQKPENLFTLNKHKGKNIILAFYPADFSSVCGSQIAMYNQLLPTFAEYNAEIFGISVDGIFCHKAFKNQYKMDITLLSDFEPKGAVSKKYGAYNTDFGFSERVLYVLDKDGKIHYSYKSPMQENPGASGILQTLKKIENHV